MKKMMMNWFVAGGFARLAACAFLSLAGAWSAYADTWTDPGTGITWTYTVSNGEASLGSGSYSGDRAVSPSTIGTITIPSTLGDCPVTGIGANAFSTCSGLTGTLAIPDSVTYIGDYAFQNCSGLSSVTMPDSVTSLGFDAFSGCSGLTSVTLPSGLTSISEGLFSGCSGLTTVVMPVSVTRIERYAFLGCQSLTNITIPATVTSIEDEAFSGCNGLADGDGFVIVRGVLYGYCGDAAEITIPDSVARIEHRAFNGCTGLTHVTIPDSVERIGGSGGFPAFMGCSGLVSITVGGNNPTYSSANGMLLSKDGSVLVEGVNGDVTIPAGVTGIWQHAFEGRGGLTSIAIPDTVTYIGDSAFFSCTNLTSMTIPDSVTSIGDSAFSGCSALTSISVGVNNPAYSSVNGMLFSKDGKTLIRGVNGDVAIPNGVTSISPNAFSDCRGLTRVTIPDSVTSIGSYAFYRCIGLTSFSVSGNNPAYSSVNGMLLTKDGKTLIQGVNSDVTIPNGVTTISGWSFVDCDRLTNVTIPDTVTSIGYSAFYGCSGLTHVTIPASVTSIAAWAFSCNNLSAIYFEGDAPAVGDDTVFRDVSPDCTVYVKEGASGWDVEIPGTWRGIGIAYSDGVDPIWTIVDGVLTGVDLNGCVDVTIPNNVTSIGDWAFEGCESLTSVTIPDSVTSIGDGAFEDCSGLTTIRIGKGLNSLGRKAFDGCTSITDIDIDERNVTFDMKDGVLYDWSRNAVVFILYSATSAVIEDGVETIESVFLGRSRLAEVRIPDTVTEIDYFGYGALPPAFRLESGFFTCDGWIMVVDVENPPLGLGGGNPPSGELNFTQFRGIANGAFDLYVYMLPVFIKHYSFDDVFVYVSSECRIGRCAFDGWDNVHIVRGGVPTYTVAYVTGANGTGTEQTDTKTEDVALTLKGAIFTRTGYTQTGWATSDGGAKVYDLGASYTANAAATLYPFWTAIEPVWTAIEPEPEPMPILYESVEGVVSALASIYDGYLYDKQTGAVKGTIQVKVGKPNAKTGLAAVKATVIGLDGKKKTLKASDKGKAQIATDGPTTVSLDGGEACTVTLGANGMSGTYGAYEIDGSLNVFASKSAADKSVAAAVLGKWQGPVNVAWRRVEDNAPYQTLSVTIANKGKVKVAGTLADGTKMSASGQLSVGEEWCCVPVVVSKKGVSLQFAVWLPAATSAAAPVVVGLGDDVKVGKPGTLKGGAAFRIDADAFAAVWGQAALPYLPDGVAVGGGAKWTLPKAGSVAYAKGTTTVDEAKTGENPSGLKLTYKAKDGTFKGSFKAYADVGGKPKATKVDVTGVLVDGVGYGAATVKKVGGVAVTVE